VCIVISASRSGYPLKIAGDAIVSIFWHKTFKCLWRNYGEIVASFYITRKFLVIKYVKLPETVHKSPVYALCNNIFVRIWIFFSISFENQVFKSLQRFTRGS